MVANQVKIQAARHMFNSWKDVVEIIFLRRWSSPTHKDNRAKNNRKIRKLLERLLEYLHEWCESVTTSRAGTDTTKLLLQAVLRPLSELVALAVSHLSKSFAVVSDNTEDMKPAKMLGFITAAILACDHDARVRGNLYMAVLHLMWGCGVSREGLWGAGQPASGSTQMALVEIGRVLDRQVRHPELKVSTPAHTKHLGCMLSLSSG